MKKLFAFFKSKTFFANAILGAVFLLLLVWGTQIWLKSITHYSEKISVPDLNGLTLTEAEALLEHNKLKFKVIDSTEFIPDIPLGAVIDQFPKAGAEVKTERQILLTINPFTVRKIELPHIIDKTLRRAVYDLESKGFKIGQLIYKPDLAKDVVLGMQRNKKPIKAGDKFIKGTTINLIIGSGLGDERIPIPYVMGLSADDAERKLRSYSLNLGLVIYDLEVTDSTSAIIYRQAPEPSLTPSIRLGTTVDIWLTNDSTKVPNDSLQFAYPDVYADSTRSYFEPDSL